MSTAAADPTRELVSHLAPVHQAHSDFIAKVAALKPARIITRKGADEADIALRELHIRTYMGQFLKFIEAMVDDLNENLTMSAKVDFRRYLSEVTDVNADYLYAPLRAAANAAEADAEWVA